MQYASLLRTVVALVLVLHRLGVLVLHRLGVPVETLGVLGLAIVSLVLVHRLGVLHPRDLGRLGVAVAALVLVRRLRVVLGLACAAVMDCQPSGLCKKQWCPSVENMYTVSVI